MKYLTQLLLAFASVTCYAQFSDDFSDGYLHYPKWMGDTSKFEVVNDELHLQNDEITDTALLYSLGTISLQNHFEFESEIHLNFNPSTNNRFRLYLLQTTSFNENTPNDGIYFQIGASGSSDPLLIYEVTNGNADLIETIPNFTFGESSHFKLKLIIDQQNWSVFIDTSAAKNTYELAHQFFYTPNINQFSGAAFWCRHTRSNHDRFVFDNVVYNGTPDTSAPFITNTETIDPQTIQIDFSSSIDSNIHFDNVVFTPALDSTFSLDYTENRIVLTHIHLKNRLPYTLSIQNIRGANNIPMRDTNVLIELNIVQPGDLIFNEIMADPEPAALLPPAEYIEFYNTSEHIIHLNQLLLSDASSTITLPSVDVQPDSFIVLTGDSSLYQIIPNSIIVPIPSLNNSEDSLTLFTHYSDIIDTLNYNNEFYHNEDRDNGGFSIERITSNPLCTTAHLWHATLDLHGGTPGQPNSTHLLVHNDIPFLKNIQHDTTLVQVELSTIIQHNWQITDEDDIIDTAYLDASEKLQLHLYNNIEPGSSAQFQLEATGCLNQKQARLVIPLKRYHEPSPQEVLFNEILFNPKSGGADYLEIINVTDDTLNLNGCQIQKRSTENINQVQDSVVLQDVLLPPHQLYVLTTQPDTIANRFDVPNPNQLLLTDLPNFPDDEGQIVLLNNLNERLDDFTYNEQMHFDYLADLNGVALERIGLSENWFSSAAAVGFGTPTAVNSQELKQGRAQIDVQPVIISPNLDGTDDFTTISFQSVDAESRVNITLLNSQLQTKKVLFQNTSLATNSTLMWDGTLSENEIAPNGYYILIIDLIASNGKRERHRKKVIITG